MKQLALGIAALAFCAAAAADVRVEPDDYPLRAALTHAAPGVTLSLAMFDGTERPDFEIISSGTYGGTASTGSRVFGAASASGEGPLFNYGSGVLRADFGVTIHAVAIDFIGCCDVLGDPQTQGLLRAFSGAGELLATATTAFLPRGVVARTTVISASTPIAYVLASTTADANNTYLDNFVASAVPAPPAGWLYASGFMVIAGTLQRRRRNATR